MKLRVATFNMENLFTRPAAMGDGSGARGLKNRIAGTGLCLS